MKRLPPPSSDIREQVAVVKRSAETRVAGQKKLLTEPVHHSGGHRSATVVVARSLTSQSADRMVLEKGTEGSRREAQRRESTEWLQGHSVFRRLDRPKLYRTLRQFAQKNMEECVSSRQTYPLHRCKLRSTGTPRRYGMQWADGVSTVGSRSGRQSPTSWGGDSRPQSAGLDMMDAGSDYRPSSAHSGKVGGASRASLL